MSISLRLIREDLFMSTCTHKLVKQERKRKMATHRREAAGAMGRRVGAELRREEKGAGSEKRHRTTVQTIITVIMLRSLFLSIVPSLSSLIPISRQRVMVQERVNVISDLESGSRNRDHGKEEAGDAICSVMKSETSSSCLLT